MRWFSLSAERARVLEAVCEAVVPGSSQAGPAVYIDSVVAEMPPELREGFLAAVDSLSGVLTEGAPLLEREQFSPAFQWIRALALEAYYGDFARPGYAGPTGWDEIDFNSDQACRLRKDWSFLRCYA